MATLTIRNLDERVKRELRKRAAKRGVSMEQEVTRSLADSIGSRRRRQVDIGGTRSLGRTAAEAVRLRSA